MTMTQLALQPLRTPAPKERPRLGALRGGAEAPVPEARAAVAPVRAAVPTLDSVLSTVWAATTAGAPAACPVCDGRMEPRWSAGAGAVGARCTGCGSELD
jgi:hypothetical protein